MNRRNVGLLAFMCLLISATGIGPGPRISAQQYDPEERETDPLVLEKLEWFQDQKFGLMMHWGPYSQWGVVESWSICSEDEPWCRRSMSNYVDYVRAYHALQQTFNPVAFDPAVWAAAARVAGMRYVVFTTKHHDRTLRRRYSMPSGPRISAPGSTSPRPTGTRMITGRRSGPPPTGTSTTASRSIPSGGSGSSISPTGSSRN